MNIKEFYWFWLTNVRGIGNRKIRYLMDEFGDICGIYDFFCGGSASAVKRYFNIDTEGKIDTEQKYNTEQKSDTGQKIGTEQKLYANQMTDTQHRCPLSETDIINLTDFAARSGIKKKYEEYIDRGIKITTIDSDDYPARLKDIYDAPYILYYRGNLPEHDRKSVAIVGARECSEYGRSMAKSIAHELGRREVEVISGFARGIDTAAHNGCMSGGGRTYAIMGSGVDRCYPLENKFTYEDIIKNGGGIISEYPPDTAPISGFFPMRNRIISGLSDVVIIIEAGVRSGSLITADHALEQGRCVMALPGRVSDRLSMGCNNLIRQGAAIVTSIDDILYELGMETELEEKTEGTYGLCGGKDKILKNLENKLANTEKMLYSQLDFNPKSIEELIKESGLLPKEISGSLVNLELMGLVVEKGGCYMRSV